MKEDVINLEQDDIIERGIKERQDWIQDYKEKHDGNPPEKIDDKFYDRKDTVEPSADEEAKAGDEDKKDSKGKKDKGKGDKGGKEKAKGGKGKKGKGETDEKVPTVEVGPTEVVEKFDTFYEDYEKVWAKRDETGNQD